MFEFEIVTRGPGEARCGQLRLTHGTVDTPAFMPCASLGVIKACPPHLVAEQGIQVMICNAYHLWQRPGSELIKQMGGLHRFMAWPAALMTDSGGFQAFSIAGNSGVSEDGFTFRSHLSGELLQLSPEKSVQLQNELGSDVAMVLDECVAYPAEKEYVVEAIERTARWAQRCKEAHGDPAQALFGIVQGGVHEELRARSAAATVEIGFDGYAIGGLSVGESKAEMLAALDAAILELPAGAPRYVMGVGTPLDILACVRRGVDLFDCVLPSRNARHGSLMTWHGPLKITRREFSADERPIDEECDCPACRRYSRAYLHHLHRIGEAAAWQLLTLHNLRFYADFMARLRQAVAEASLDELQGRLSEWTVRESEHTEEQE